MDYKNKIIEELKVLQQKEQQDRNVFKARAYGKVIAELTVFKGAVRNMEDVKAIPGVGEKIRAKIAEILDTGVLRAAEVIKADGSQTILKQLMNIYGIGPVKAKALVAEHDIKTVNDLRTLVARSPSVLNEKQKIGLQYYEDLQQRIPRNEMEEHEKLLQRSTQRNFEMVVVGSYRRGKPDSGDIDVLLFNDSDKTDQFPMLVKKLQEEKYILEILAVGPKKCMAIVKLPHPGSIARRLDLLVTPRREFPYALLYFTGSDKFNIRTRKRALELGYTMNEHGMTVQKEGVAAPPLLETEEAILKFLGIPYVKPEERV